MSSSDLPSVASPRHFTLPLASSSERSSNASQKSHHRASVSTSANPTVSARRAAGKSRGGKRGSHDGLDSIAGGSGEGSPVASGSPESTRGAQRSFQFPIGTVQQANVNAAAVLVSNHPSSAAAAAVPPISVVQSPRHLAPAGAAAAAAIEYQNALNDAAMLSPIDGDTVLSSISSALRAEEANENGGQVGETPAAAPASSSASSKLPRMLPSLPPSFLASLVRSHVRHVGLSASLKRRTQVRELMADMNERKNRVTLKARAKNQLPFQPHASGHLQLRGLSVSEEKQQQQSSQASRGASISPIRSRRSPRRGLGVLAAMKAEEALTAQGGMSMRERLTAMGALPPPPSSNENESIPPPPIVPWPSWQDEAANEDDSDDDDEDDSEDDEREEEQIWRDQRGDELGLVSSAQSAIETRATRRRERKRRKEQRAMRVMMESRADVAEEPEQSVGGLKMPPIKAPKSARGRLGMLSSSLGGLKGSFAPVVNNQEVNVAAAIKNLNIHRNVKHITTNSVREEDY